ncbi:MAG: L,D-transpeptidase [Anaerolineales bacterium]|nr:L,D-transpeptidase [Anaerolineales bacterium]
MNRDGAISRRDFLKLSVAGLMGLLGPGLHLDPARAAGTMQGRVTYNNVSVYDAPSKNGKKVSTFRRDSVLEISEQVTGGKLRDYNRAWYRISDQGYVYSGGIQPVETRLNEVVTNLPEAGTVGEITVPYSESWWAINRTPFPGARLYYATTHWIKDIVVDKRDGSLWYRAYDHLYSAYYYIRPYNVRILPTEELTPLSPAVPPEDKYIEVRLDEQTVVAYEGERLVFNARTSTGKAEFATPTGRFRTFHKRPTARMVGGESDAALYDLTGVPWDCYITENAVALHSTFWHNDYGTPHSHGCINLSPQAAKWLYRWTLPTVPSDQRSVYEPGSGTDVQVVEHTHQRRPNEPRFFMV